MVTKKQLFSEFTGKKILVTGGSGSVGKAIVKTAQYLEASWRSGYAAVCKTAYTGSIPVLASKTQSNSYLRNQSNLSQTQYF